MSAAEFWEADNKKGGGGEAEAEMECVRLREECEKMREERVSMREQHVKKLEALDQMREMLKLDLYQSHGGASVSCVFVYV